MEGVVNKHRCGDLAEETKLPRDLIERFSEMWDGREPPHFAKVSSNGTLSQADLAELVRSLRISSGLLCRSVARVIGAGGNACFEQFVRGYASLHSRTLVEALPFSFAVFDLDGDGIVSQEEFTQVLDETMAMQSLDSTTIKKVLKTPAADDMQVTGITYDNFRYFASLSGQTILACCGFLLHVHESSYYMCMRLLTT